MNTPYDERKQAAQERLRTAFDAQTNRERMMVDWLIGCFTADEADEWSEMVERQVVEVEHMPLAELRQLVRRAQARADQLVAEGDDNGAVAEFDRNRASR